ncbi:hypothetical protein BH11BAC2_BH11BAC2_24910 [soil metagenome]
MIDPTEKQYLKARSLLSEGKPDEAVQELSLILALQPDNGKGQALLGHLMFRYFKDYVGAENAFRNAIKQAPTYAELYIDYAEMLLVLERYTETVAILNKSLEVPGIEKDKVNRLFGMLYERQTKWDEAIAYYNKSLIFTFSNEDLKIYEADIARCLMKKGKVQ